MVGYVPAEAAGAPLAIILVATGIGQLTAAVWAAALGHRAVAGIFAIFTRFRISCAELVFGLLHGWFALPEEAAVPAQELFLIAWLATIVLLTLTTLRLPLAVTVLFTLISGALALTATATATGSEGPPTAGGLVVFSFVGVGAYLFVHATSVATGPTALRSARPVIGG